MKLKKTAYSLIEHLKSSMEENTYENGLTSIELFKRDIKKIIEALDFRKQYLKMVKEGYI